MSTSSGTTSGSEALLLLDEFARMKAVRRLALMQPGSAKVELALQLVVDTLLAAFTSGTAMLNIIDSVDVLVRASAVASGINRFAGERRTRSDSACIVVVKQLRGLEVEVS